MKTSKMVLVGLVALALIALAAPSFAESANATAELVTAISIEKVDDLDFGAMVVAQAGTSIIEASAAGTRTGTATMVTSDDGNAAKFHVTGDGVRTFAITLTQPTDGVIITDDGGDATEKIDVVLVRDAATGTLVDSEADIYVGGTATIAAEDIVGAYTGTFGVTVAYN